MKQIIVLAAFIALGIFIAGTVMDFKTDVESMSSSASSALTSITNSMKSES
ncbi:MAG: hypothetical protein ACI4LO_00960 [Anaerovoracaceae bacterium]